MTMFNNARARPSDWDVTKNEQRNNEDADHSGDEEILEVDVVYLQPRSKRLHNQLYEPITMYIMIII